MKEAVSAAVGAGVAAVVMFGGVTTYQSVSTDSTQRTNPDTVGYADE